MSKKTYEVCRTNKTFCTQEQLFCHRNTLYSHQYIHVSSKSNKRACNSCRLKKRGCDKLRPIFTRCKTTGTHCSYYTITSNSDKELVKPTFVFDITKISLFQHKKFNFKPRSNFMEYDDQKFRLIYNGKNVLSIVPTAIIKDLFYTFYFNKVQINGKTISNQIYEVSKFNQPTTFLKISLLNHLVQIFFTRINSHHPVFPECYFKYLIKHHPNHQSTHILLFSMCLASLTLFPRTTICIQLRQFYYNCFLTSLKNQYNNSSIPLLLSYRIMGTLSTPDLCHNQVKPPIFYLNQILIHLPMLGIHMKIPSKIPIKNTLFRNSLIFSLQFIQYVNSNAILNYQSASYLYDVKFSDRKFLFIRPCQPPSNLTLRNQTIEKYLSFIVFVKKLDFLSLKLVRLSNRSKLDHSEAKQNLQVEIHSYILEAEISLFSAYFGTKFNKDGSLIKDRNLQVPTNCKLIHNFIIVLTLVFDFNKPLTKFDDLAFTKPRTESEISIHEFLTCSSEIKLITIIQMINQVFSRHSLYYVDSGFSFRWWYIYNKMIFLKRFQDYLQSHSALTQVSDLINQTILCLTNLLKLGQERSEVPQFILETLDSTEEKNKTQITLPLRLHV